MGKPAPKLSMPSLTTREVNIIIDTIDVAIMDGRCALNTYKVDKATRVEKYIEIKTLERLRKKYHQALLDARREETL